MTDIANPQRFLQNLGAGDTAALALKAFSGTVLDTFYKETILYNMRNEMISIRQLNGSVSAQWPILGRDPEPIDHTPGVFLQGDFIETTEKTVSVDDILVAKFDVPRFDLEISHFDVMAPYAMKLGRTLAETFDERAFNMVCQAATDTAGFTTPTGVYDDGATVDISGFSGADPTSGLSLSEADANTFRNAVAALAYELDQRYVPRQGRYLVIHPYYRQLLRYITEIYDRDFGPGSSPNDLNTRQIGVLEGFNVMWTWSLPAGNITTGPDKYRANFTTAGSGIPLAVAICNADGMSPIGCVDAFGIESTIREDDRRNTMFMKAQMMCGFGVIAPWCAGMIRGIS